MNFYPIRSKARAGDLFLGMNCIAILASATTMTKRVKLCARPIDRAKRRSRNVNR